MLRRRKNKIRNTNSWFCKTKFLNEKAIRTNNGMGKRKYILLELTDV